jgi:hypothetical protein
MSTLNGLISFAVKFDFTGAPTLVLTPSTTIPGGSQPYLVGYYDITQPDGITRSGSYDSPDLIWNGSGYDAFSIPLRLGSDQKYQKGEYIITLYAACDGYLPGTAARRWNMGYKPVAQTLENQFDCFIPSLKYEDTTNYQVSNYNITAATNAWSAVSTPGNPTGTSPVFDLAISGQYYDATYAITYIKNVSYIHASKTWLTVDQRFTNNITAKSFIPASMNFLLTYLVAVKDALDAVTCCGQQKVDLYKIYSQADQLYMLMRARVCAQNTAGLADNFNEYYRITHNYQAPYYVNTNGVIPPYDFTTGCGGSGGGGTTTLYYNYTAPTDGITNIATTLTGKTVGLIFLDGIERFFTQGTTVVVPPDGEFYYNSTTGFLYYSPSLNQGQRVRMAYT